MKCIDETWKTHTHTYRPIERARPTKAPLTTQVSWINLQLKEKQFDNFNLKVHLFAFLVFKRKESEETENQRIKKNNDKERMPGPRAHHSYYFCNPFLLKHPIVQFNSVVFFLGQHWTNYCLLSIWEQKKNVVLIFASTHRSKKSAKKINKRIRKLE